MPQGLLAPKQDARLASPFSTRGQAEWVRSLVPSRKGLDFQCARKSVYKTADAIRCARGEGRGFWTTVGGASRL